MTSLLRPLAFPLSLALAAGCSAPQFELIPRAMNVDLGGDFAADAGGLSTGENTFDALGISADDVEFVPRIDFSAGGFELTVDYLDVGNSGTGQIEQEIEFDGQTFTVGTAVESELELTFARGVATFDIIPTDTVDIAIGAGVGYADERTTFTDPITSNSASTDEAAPFPFIAARAGIELGAFSVDLLAGWLEVDVDDVEASYLDLDAMVRWSFIGGNDHLGGALIGGYRHIDLELDYEDGSDSIAVDAELTGPYLGLSLVL